MPYSERFPRVLFLEALPTISGGQSALLDLMPAVLTQFDAAVVVPAEGPLADALRTCGVSPTIVPMASYTLVEKKGRDVLRFIGDTPRLTWRLARLVHRISASLVYINNSRAFVAGTCSGWLNRRPVIWHAHNVFGDSKTRALVSWAARLKTVRTIICPSEGAAAQFAEQRHKVVVVPSGVDLARFAPSAAARATQRAELGISSDSPTIGIIGDLIPLKGQDAFVRAADRIQGQASDLVFLIVGDERPTPESRAFKDCLQAEIDKSKSRTRRIGFRADIAGLINALDILVVASSTETGPLVMLQALACGVPVLSTPVGLAPALLGDGLCGEIFPIGDDAALAEKILRLIRAADVRAGMRRLARERAVERLDLKIFQERIATIIQQAIP